MVPQAVASAGADIYRSEPRRAIALRFLDEARRQHPSTKPARAARWNAEEYADGIQPTGTPLFYSLFELFVSSDYERSYDRYQLPRRGRLESPCATTSAPHASFWSWAGRTCRACFRVCSGSEPRLGCGGIARRLRETLPSAPRRGATSLACVFPLIAAPIARTRYFVLAIPLLVLLLSKPLDAQPGAALMIQWGIATLAIGLLAASPLKAITGVESRLAVAGWQSGALFLSLGLALFRYRAEARAAALA